MYQFAFVTISSVSSGYWLEAIILLGLRKKLPMHLSFPKKGILGGFVLYKPDILVSGFVDCKCDFQLTVRKIIFTLRRELELAPRRGFGNRIATYTS